MGVSMKAGPSPSSMAVGPGGAPCSRSTHFRSWKGAHGALEAVEVLAGRPQLGLTPALAEGGVARFHGSL